MLNIRFKFEIRFNEQTHLVLNIILFTLLFISDVSEVIKSIKKIAIAFEDNFLYHLHQWFLFDNTSIKLRPIE